MSSHFRPAEAQDLGRFSSKPEKVKLIYPADVWPGIGAPVLLNRDGGSWQLGAFGLVPYWAEPPLARSTFVARSETAGEKHSFRNAWTRRQFCIIPARCIFEPCHESGREVPWQIERADGAPFGIAGLWEHRPGDEGVTRWSFSMLTINADGHLLMNRFHRPGEEKRSVVILPPNRYEDWLSARTEHEARALLQPFDAVQMNAFTTQESMF